MELFQRINNVMLRSPKAILGLLGLSTFTSFLIISIFGGIGESEIDFSDRTKTQKTFKNWIGFASYITNDMFAASLFSNIISIPEFAPVFKRELASGLYSVHMYYFGNWVCKMMTLGFYPAMLISIFFYPLKLVDSSEENLLEFLKIGYM